MSEIRINVKFSQKPTGKWEDTEKRSDHIFEKMRRESISVQNIRDAVIGGSKKIRQDGSVVVDYRWFRVIYREFRIGDIKKIYPITVYGVVT